MKTPVISRLALGAMALAAAFAVSNLAVADEAPAKPDAKPAQKERGGRGQGRGPLAVLKDLDLTDAQKAQVKEITDAQDAKRDAIRADTTKSNKDKRQAQQDLREETLTKIRAILTPEQQTKFDAAVAEQKAKREKREKPAA